MRTTWRSALVPATVTVLVCAAPAAVSQQHREEPEHRPQSPPRTYQADCRTVIEGSRATAYCHNPYPSTDRVRLHVECERWWDIDADSAPVDVGPADYAELTDRCWKEIGEVWVSHQPVGDSPGT
ncbi:hypothetical protein FBY35_5134 [Streptomyces sp. SLBN-118]|uniref:hypothetical protein n=1 Tax=Streptomyces sp. SLBN-118 TaxID=2768454 RepID=UPI00114F58B3|nr:hypothetical protein [Streptomyces sp. SLBN-118]TQK43662.1 hypothetical protein FBY35_5134 [Streptomyces sp. SLBN-118]